MIASNFSTHLCAIVMKSCRDLFHWMNFNLYCDHAYQEKTDKNTCIFSPSGPSKLLGVVASFFSLKYDMLYVNKKAIC